MVKIHWFLFFLFLLGSCREDHFSGWETGPRSKGFSTQRFLESVDAFLASNSGGKSLPLNPGKKELQSRSRQTFPMGFQYKKSETLCLFLSWSLAGCHLQRGTAQPQMMSPSWRLRIYPEMETGNQPLDPYKELTYQELPELPVPMISNPVVSSDHFPFKKQKDLSSLAFSLFFFFKHLASCFTLRHLSFHPSIPCYITVLCRAGFPDPHCLLYLI